MRALPWKAGKELYKYSLYVLPGKEVPSPAQQGLAKVSGMFVSRSEWIPAHHLDVGKPNPHSTDCPRRSLHCKLNLGEV